MESTPAPLLVPEAEPVAAAAAALVTPAHPTLQSGSEVDGVPFGSGPTIEAVPEQGSAEEKMLSRRLSLADFAEKSASTATDLSDALLSMALLKNPNSTAADLHVPGVEPAAPASRSSSKRHDPRSSSKGHAHSGSKRGSKQGHRSSRSWSKEGHRSSRGSLHRGSSAEDLNDIEVCTRRHRGMTEFLLEASEVETRLRQHTLELVQPTIKKQGVQDGRFKDLKAALTQTRIDVDELLAIKGASESVTSLVDNFRVELADFHNQKQEHEMQLGKRLTNHEVEINGLRQSLELLKGVDHTSVNRSLQTMGDMLAQYKDENTDLRRFCIQRLDLNRDKTVKLRDEFETRTMAMEDQMHVLQDMQIQTNTKIDHIDEVVTLMDGRVVNSCDGVADLWRSKASVKCLEEQQQDLGEFMRHVNGTVSSLKNQFGSLTDDVKAHFETATTLVGRSTADQMMVMREQYQQDLERVNVMQTTMKEFVDSQKAGLDKIGAALQLQTGTANTAIGDLNSSLEGLRRKIDLDQQNAKIETGIQRKLIRDIEGLLEGGGDTAALDEDPSPAAQSTGPGPGVGDSTPGGVSHHGGGLHLKADALATFVESAWMGLACDLQDENDRKNIGLFGVKSATCQDKGMGLPDITIKKAPMMSPSSSPRKSKGARRSVSGYGDVGEGFIEPVVSIDTRCLSCSGSAPTVLAGFKMACLHYEPGPVEYEGSRYTRSELVRKRMELLLQARAALKPAHAPRSLD